MLSPASQYECEVFLNPRLPKPPVGWRYAGRDVGFVWDIEATKARHEGELARRAKLNGS